MKTICMLLLVGAASCGSDDGDSPGVGLSGFAGSYAATYAGSFMNTTPNNTAGTNTDSATITVSDVKTGQIELTWQVAGNAPSGSILFAMNGSSGSAVLGSGQNSCFMGALNGNTQTNCCMTCTISFSSSSFSQHNAGSYSGTTAQNVTYTGNYIGVWTGNKQ